MRFTYLFYLLSLLGVPITKAQEPHSTAAIDESVLIENNGAKLFVQIKGTDPSNPVVLFLHGGPGDVILGLYPFQVYAGKRLEEDFTMVYLHQRGTGNSGPVPLNSQTVAHHVQDVAKVVDYVLDRFDRDKIHLMGHSWGGMLGTLYLIHGREKIDRFVAVAPPFDSRKNARASFDMTLGWAEKVHRSDALQELGTQIDLPVDSFGEQMILSKWASQAHGGIAKGLSMRLVLDGMGIDELEENWQDNSVSIARFMDAELQGVDVTGAMEDLTHPILFMAAVHDANVPSGPVQEVYENYQGPKDFVLFSDSHHLPFVAQTDKFVAGVLDFLLRQTE